MVGKKAKIDARRRIEIIDRDLYHLREVRRGYCKRLVKMGMVSWAIGVLVFAAAALVLVGPQVLLRAPNLWLPLLIVAPAAPFSISAMFVRKLYKKEKHLELLRKSLMGRYEKEMLKKVEKLHKR
jgi:O-antigen/teichoic acid export membrane protein